MPRKNCLVKISGDALGSETLDWIKDLSSDNFVVVCVGGGTQINEAFIEAGLPVGKFGPLGRETQTFQERQLARDVLEKNQAAVQDELALRGVYASVVIPVLDIGTVLCHINGDQFVLAAYHGFDSIFVVTTIERVEEKAKLFAPYQKIVVVGFPAALVGRREMVFVSTTAMIPSISVDSGLSSVINVLDEEEIAILRSRAVFVDKYCGEKGWNKDDLTMKQIFEIRDQSGWENPLDIKEEENT